MSQVDVLSKRLNLGSNKQHHWIAQEVYFFWQQKSARNWTGCSPLRGFQMQVWWVKIGDFRQITGYISKAVQDRRQFLLKSNIGSRMRSIEWWYCRWPWVTPSAEFYFKSANIWQSYKQECGCLMHLARMANTLLLDEESARDNHVFACNFAKINIHLFKKKFTLRLSNKPFLIWLLTNQYSATLYLVICR